MAREGKVRRSRMISQLTAGVTQNFYSKARVREDALRVWQEKGGDKKRNKREKRCTGRSQAMKTARL